MKVDPVALYQLLEDEGATYRQNKRSYIFPCPRCGKKDKLMMFKSDGRFVCWVCAELSGFRGRPEFALQEILGMSLEAIRTKIYGKHFGEDLDLDDGHFLTLPTLQEFCDGVVPRELEEIVKGIRYPLDFYPIGHEHSRRGREYLEGRGISVDIATAYDLRYCPVQRRVIFPVKVGEKVLGWQARAIFPTEWEDEETGETRKAPKVLTTGPRDMVLMFQDRLAGSDHAIVCEGPVDALKCHLAGGNVATMGKIVSEKQMKIVRGSGVKKIYLALDFDAQAEARDLVAALEDLEIYRLLPAPGYEDLGAMPMEAVPARFRSAERIDSAMPMLGLPDRA